MSDPFAPRVGGVLSADIAVPEHEREVRFYSRVLSTGESPLWREDLMNNLGMPIIGLGARSKEHEMLPLQWMPHIQVADVATSVERALGLGGSELMHGKDDDGKSQWAVLLDPKWSGVRDHSSRFCGRNVRIRRRRIARPVGACGMRRLARLDGI